MPPVARVTRQFLLLAERLEWASVMYSKWQLTLRAGSSPAGRRTLPVNLAELNLTSEASSVAMTVGAATLAAVVKLARLFDDGAGAAFSATRRRW